jgi:uncharacterized membrane protein
MNWYSLLVFIHVVSAIILSAGTLLSLFGQIALRRAERVEQARSILGLLAISEPVVGIAIVLTPVVGIIMTVNTWGWQTGWINVALGSMLFLLFPVGAFTGIRRGKIAKAVEHMPDGPLPASIHQQIHAPLHGTTGNLMVTLVLGMEFLMTTKPALNGSLITIAASVLLGVAVSLPLWHGEAVQKHGHDNNLNAVQ